MPGNFRDLKFCNSTLLKWQLIFFFIISQTIIYSQVRIREKLEISPKPKGSHLLNKTASASHTMRISAHWHTDVNANIQAKMIVRDIFDENLTVASSDWIAGHPEGDITLTISNAVCYYDVEIIVKGFTNNYQSADVKTNVYWDDMLVSVYDDDAISEWDYGYLYGEAGYFGTSRIWIADFRAGYEPLIGDDYCFEMPVRINDLISDGPVYYPAKDSIKITILKGDDLFWLYDLNTGERYEKTVSALPTFFMMYNLVPKGPLPVKDSVEIVLQFQIKDDIKTLSHMLYNLNNGYVYTYCNGSQRVSYKDKKEIEAYIMNDCGNVPADAVLKAEIKKGSEYGTLIDAFSGNTGDVLTNLDMSNGYADVLFFANGKEPAGEDTVIIEWTTSKDNIRRDVDALIVERAPLKISLIPPEISPGDTALIKLQKWDYLSGSYSALPEGQTFEIGIQDGCGLGYILLPDSTRNNYYKGNYSPEFTLKFVASDSLDSDSVSVDFRAGYPNNGINAIASPAAMSLTKSALSKDGGSAGIKKHDTAERMEELYKAVSLKLSSDRRFSSLPEAARGTMLAKLKEKIEKAPAAEKSMLIGGGDDGGYGQTCAGVSYIYPEKGSASELIVRSTEIMLGETKYFQTKLNENNELVIEEVKADLGAEPQCTGIKEDIWGDNPVTPAASGNKCGVYWEKKCPDGNNLPTGLIRLIGRYWEKDKTYKVKLTAIDKSKRTKTIEVEVKKPSKLGNSNNNANDVFGDRICIDDLCIETAGKIGIPPQIIKGQMQKETGFTNAFRYEPFLDISYQSKDKVKKELFDDYPYFSVTSANTGTIAIPVTHTNVSPNLYPNQPQKIGDYIVNNIYKYIQKPSKKNGNAPTVVGMSKGTLSIILKEAYKNLMKIDEKSAYTKAVDTLKKYIKSDQYEDKDKYAQTRIITSYGMLQQTFYDAHYKKLAGFSVSNSNQSPELLNEKDYSMKSYSERIQKLTKKKAEYNWTEGYEKSWLKILSGYNSGEGGYGNDVLNNSKLFLPVK